MKNIIQYQTGDFQRGVKRLHWTSEIGCHREEWKEQETAIPTLGLTTE